MCCVQFVAIQIRVLKYLFFIPTILRKEVEKSSDSLVVSGGIDYQMISCRKDKDKDTDTDTEVR